MLAIVGSQTFYSTAAQVIPVLALVQFVERRERKLHPTVDAVAVWAMVAAAGVGEMVAFRNIYWGHAAPKDQVWVIAALILAGLAVVLPVVGPLTWDLVKRRRETSAQLGLAVSAAAIAFLVVAFLAAVHR